MQDTQEHLEVRYLGLVQGLRELVVHPDRCLSAAVYTELTDVEAEVNGWLTYDRSVNKMLVRIDVGCLDVRLYAHGVSPMTYNRMRGQYPGRTRHCSTWRAASTQLWAAKMLHLDEQ